MIPMEIIATIRSDFPSKFGIPRHCTTTFV